MLYTMERYIIVFSSSYHCHYIESFLNSYGINNTIRKAPRAIAKSCHIAIYIGEKDLEKVLKLIKKTRVSYEGLYEIIKSGNQAYYKKVVL